MDQNTGRNQDESVRNGGGTGSSGGSGTGSGSSGSSGGSGSGRSAGIGSRNRRYEPRPRSSVPVEFSLNAVYTTEMAAKILHRSPKAVRFLCKNRRIASQMDRTGFLITGWSIRDYAEGRLVTQES